MSERWVCSRCYTSAEESATTCPNCGTPRGAAPAAAAAEPTTPPPASEPGESAGSATNEAAGPAPEATASLPPAGVDSGERWVCLRCFVSNDGSAAECANCGLLRGSGPPADDPGAWAAAQQAAAAGSQPSRFPWRWVGFGVIALLVVGGSILFAARRDDSGDITGAGTLDVQDLRVGDCFDLEDERSEETTEVSTVRAIPCDEAHVYEMYFAGEYPEGELPTAADEPYSAWEEDSCVGSFESYVGLDFDSSKWYFSSLTPTDESWAAGDRLLQCFLHNFEESPVTGSAQGTAE